MITLERLKEVLSYGPYLGEFTWKDIPVVARARGGTTTPDMAGEASRNVPDRRIHFLAPVRLKCDAHKERRIGVALLVHCIAKDPFSSNSGAER